jgi:hypothetical protein
MADEAPPITDTTKTSADSINASIEAQAKLLTLSTQANTAMAYLQMALGLTSKISGR